LEDRLFPKMLYLVFQLVHLRSIRTCLLLLS